ncbi:MFS general substrate transporter [Periconia macrospinosa]|uniref:MFS general substrate transporter n=1 Tax=Periconia macrospinosa TaxID=97972 RepID=A0A2V1DC59_9PLEO|nr:MFS general substrate transporter [Periconia macrospinosa]
MGTNRVTDTAIDEVGIHQITTKDEEDSPGDVENSSASVAEDVVDWKGEDDPEKPMNWSKARKAKNIIVICYCSFLTPLGSTMFAPAISQVMQEFQSNSAPLASFVISSWILGYFFGPLFLGPLSELYGRQPVYLVCNFLYSVFNVATALAPSLSSLIVFRFLAGTFGGCPFTLGAGTFGDTIKPENRGMVIAMWSIGSLLGPILGPIGGGYLGENSGWRWNCWVLAIAAGVGAIATVIFQEETYPVVLLERKAAKLRKETGNANLKSVYADLERKPAQVFARSIVRPLKLLFFSPIVATLSVYQGVMYGVLYLLFTTYPLVFESRYHFSTGSIGLTYLGAGIGSFISLVVTGTMADQTYRKQTELGRWKAEWRLFPVIFLSFSVPVGLFWYGWSAQTGTHWILPILGTGFIGLGMNTIMMCIATYLIDAHPLYEASAAAALTAVRSLIGCLVPLFGRSMYAALGLGWGNSLLGFIALAMCPLPWVFFTYGERVRTNPRFQLKM